MIDSWFLIAALGRFFWFFMSDGLLHFDNQHRSRFWYVCKYGIKVIAHFFVRLGKSLRSFNHRSSEYRIASPPFI